MTTFTPDQLREAYAFQVRQGYVSDMGRTAAAMHLAGDDADDELIERLAIAIGRAVKSAHGQVSSKEYAARVMQAFDDMDHVDRREFRERKAAVERQARRRL
ncbi:hypothetical protein [Paracoccus methylarcula]|uniref:Uncharacterized protein n=1 Tax=Paracoccus methylarcula TaxID=72022 RepID=A0A3R7Q399_9RHOB|nr:hypothetical protein [Paracoccus methylarcula]RNF35062.1 hypothetical protein A7A09_008850 [Paracoccus methylarcula]